jgi:heat shock protein HslJ
MCAHRNPAVLVFVLSLALAGCASQAGSGSGAPAVQADPTGLTGAEWTLKDLGGRALIDGVPATLTFPEAGTVAGKASCNRFSGSVAIKVAAISFGALATTRMACEPAIDEQERAYLTALQSAERFAIDGSTLSIFCKGMDRPLVFARMATP